MKVIGLELYKLRHKHLFLMVILFLFVEMTWAFMATRIFMSRNPDNAGWKPLISMISSMNGLFMPILTAVSVSRICDMEHKGNTWKLLLSISVRRSALYRAKYISGFIIMLWGCLFQIVAIIVFGITNGFEKPVPSFLLIRFVMGTVLTTMTIIAIQQWVSMAVKNQAFAVSFGMIGGFIGMAADFFPLEVRRIFIWSYYTGLSPITQIYTRDKIHFVVRDMSSLLPMIMLLITVGISTYIVGNIHVSRQEI